MSTEHQSNTPVAAETPVVPKVIKPAGNPLAKYFRQPAIYVGLPSGGKYWPEGSLEMPDSGEFPVYPLTSRDEITLRTPDALMNGQGVIDVIQSCIPGIKDAWKMPAGDIDSVLIAIRIASYGHSMDFENKCPHCGEEHSYSMDLRHLMGSIKFPDYDTPAELHGLTVKFQPSTYKALTELNIANYEISRTSIAIETADEETKRNALTTSLNRVVSLNQGVLSQSTESITDNETGDVITDQNYIREFYNQIDSRLFNQLQEILTEKTKDASLKPVPVNCQSCDAKIDLTIMFDYSSFFVVGS